jgi:hypothetical protein
MAYDSHAPVYTYFYANFSFSRLAADRFIGAGVNAWLCDGLSAMLPAARDCS